jgi:seryl-tRNA synthetase
LFIIKRVIAKHDFEGAKAEKNKISKVVAEKKKSSKGKDPCTEEVAQSKALDAKIEELVQKREDAEKQLEKALGSIGNIVHKDVVISKTEDDNPVLRTWGEINKDLVVNGEDLGKLHHHQVMQCLDFIEMERGSKVAGHRGYYLKGFGVMLNQALINFGIQTLAKKDYTACQAPFFMKKSVMEQTCQLSDFSENLYQVEGTDDSEPLYLIATSEQPISAMHKGEWIEPSDLPMRYAGISTCFRKEAGSHGKDVWGLFRIHQFEKVEQFIYCDPKKSWEELDRMVATSEEFYKALELPYQVIGLVSSELNDAAAMKMDLEAWFPGYNAYRELVSCSNCTDFQSRALEIRYALKNTDEKLYVHLLNGTLCATERTMCCIVENYQTPEGLRIPKVLQPFMGGVEFIPYNKKATDKLFKAMEEDKKREAQKAKKGGNKKAANAKASAAGKEEKKQAKEEPKKEQ